MKVKTRSTSRIIQGDCLDVLRSLKSNSVDTIITDPPYGLSFMGKRWDYDVPSTELWNEALRVLKPGGTALIFAGSRTQHRMAVNVEDAGFILKDVIVWLYGSGFPKATDISKQLDKGHKREVIGKNKNHRVIPENKIETSQSGITKHNEFITAPATPAAQLWNGWKSHGLKPAYEPILVAMKPNDGSYAENALKHGVAGLNIDGGRIDGEYETRDRDTSKGNSIFSTGKGGGDFIKTKGRFPANVILDEEAGKMLDAQSGVSKSTTHKRGDLCDIRGGNFNSGINTKIKNTNKESGVTDSGGASRFFYCAKASKAERNKGCEGLPVGQATGGGGGVGEYKDDVNSCSGKYGSEKAQARNHHPTVKPLALMEYLCKLTRTPTGGIVLDPFAGSGTTLLAAKNTNRPYIGIEREAEYIKVAEARLNG